MPYGETASIQIRVTRSKILRSEHAQHRKDRKDGTGSYDSDGRVSSIVLPPIHMRRCLGLAFQEKIQQVKPPLVSASVS
jgi:hypothetical protein